MLDTVADILRKNELSQGQYAEPYAGGCGLALSLLLGGYVADIYINDIDPAIWAFWYVILNDTEAFVNLVMSTPLSIDEWMRQKETYRRCDNRHTLSLGFSAFYLNRTNRSGIIKRASVIGGLDQKGKYKIDCRYNTEELVRRIRRVKRYEQQIHLSNLDAIQFLDDIKKVFSKKSLIMIDPPYYKVGSRLYTNFYTASDHALLASAIAEIGSPWMLTYDDVDEIRRLYVSARQFYSHVKYSAQEKKLGAELIILSDDLKLPPNFEHSQISTALEYSIT